MAKTVDEMVQEKIDRIKAELASKALQDLESQKAILKQRRSFELARKLESERRDHMIAEAKLRFEVASATAEQRAKQAMQQRILQAEVYLKTPEKDLLMLNKAQQLRSLINKATKETSDQQTESKPNGKGKGKSVVPADHPSIH